MVESSIVDFYQQFYIPEIKKLVFHLPHVLILGTHHCGNTHREAFKRYAAYHDVLCHQNDAERVVASFNTKFYQNTIVIIDMYLSKALYWNTLVPQTKKNPY